MGLSGTATPNLQQLPSRRSNGPTAPLSVMDLGSYHAFCPNSVFLLQLNGSLNPGLFSAVLEEPPFLFHHQLHHHTTFSPSAPQPPCHSSCRRPLPTQGESPSSVCFSWRGAGRALAISRLSQRNSPACCCYFR